jgi:hypothetical protein
MHHSNCKTASSLACLYFVVKTTYPPLYGNDSIGRNSNLEKSHKPNLIFLERQISLAGLIQVSRPQTYAKRNFIGVAHWHFLLNELCPRKRQSLGFHSEHRATILLPTWQLMDVLPKLQHLNALAASTPAAVTLVRSFTAKRNVCPWARSGFKPESLIHFMPWNRNAGKSECYVLSGRSLCEKLITLPEESYRLWCAVCDLETSWMRWPWPTGDCHAKNKQNTFFQICL